VSFYPLPQHPISVSCLIYLCQERERETERFTIFFDLLRTDFVSSISLKQHSGIALSPWTVPEVEPHAFSFNYQATWGWPAAYRDESVHPQLGFLRSCTSRVLTLRFRRFWHDKTERKDILRRDIPIVYNFMSLQIVGCLKFMVFDILGTALHHQLILWHQMGPWTFSKHHGLLVELPSAKIHFGKWHHHNKSGKLVNLTKSSFFCKWLPFLCIFFGPHGTHRTATN